MIEELENLSKSGDVDKKISYRFRIPYRYRQMDMNVVEKIVNEYYKYYNSKKVNSEDCIIILNIGGFYEVELKRYIQSTTKIEDIERELFDDYSKIKNELERMLGIKRDLDMFSVEVKKDKLSLDKIWKNPQNL